MYPQGKRILVCNYKLELYLKKVLVPKSRVILLNRKLPSRQMN